MNEPKVVVLKQEPGIVNNPAQIGWRLVKNAPIGKQDVLRLRTFLKPGECSIWGSEMVRRGDVQGRMAGQLHAERLFCQFEEIPSEWREFKLVFVGTLWEECEQYYERYSGEPDCVLLVVVMECQNGVWSMDYAWLDQGFGDEYRLVEVETGTTSI